MHEHLLAFIFLFINFFHGVFASGFVPILNKELGVDSAMPFALYFLGLVIGQLLIYKYSFLSKSKKSYGIYEICFGLSLVFMALFNGKSGFNIGRLLEGIAGGLITPLLFANVLSLEKVGSKEKRLVLFSSITSLGFVLGPFIVSSILRYLTYQSCLLIFSLLFLTVPIVTLIVKMPDLKNDEDTAISLKAIFSDKGWFDKFAPLFLIKYFYGFFLAFLPSYLILYFKHHETIPQIMFVFSVIFIIGQIATSKLIKVVDKEIMTAYFPLVQMACLVMFFITTNPYYMYVAGFFHSAMNFIAYLNFGVKAFSAREFAFFNCITDSAIFLGSLLANFDIFGVWGIIVIFPATFIRYLMKKQKTIPVQQE